MNQNATLLLEDGTIFCGKSLGKIGLTTGELCFNTGMTGYQEIYTDPSYFGQIVVNTNAHIGNYGTIAVDNESNSVKISGLVCNSFSTLYSRQTAQASLQEYLEQANIVGIHDIDTRALVRHIRIKGAMNGIISSDNQDISFLQQKLAETPNMNGLELSSKVSTTQAYFVGNPEAKYRVAALDLGIKQNILNNLASRDCYIQVFPAKTSFAEMQTFAPHGYFISNGPGDPAPMDYAVATVQNILANNIPLFGICLGHQILGLACGISTYKLHHGHRGLNHPVKNIITGRCEITSQNHGFGVSEFDVARSNVVEATHINLNDNSIEGLRVKDKPAFSVQYHPESSPGPHDSRYLFDDFLAMIASSSSL
ncbi:MAG: glutamine-hydrolyzing carbamoyl-phosphate synthase small subunit [Microscillaceae bacterium]|jgi:carbamoyl-phosphate synthase small subunit|nr:glutamine-hydrolyzing carbamoyl-phosphate synthase small subunit [Microscillaceae bacterium]